MEEKRWATIFEAEKIGMLQHTRRAGVFQSNWKLKYDASIISLRSKTGIRGFRAFGAFDG